MHDPTSSEPLAAILDQLPVGLLVLEPGGAITLANEAARQLLAPREVALGLSVATVLPELRAGWHEEEAPRSEVLFLPAPDGRRRPVACVRQRLAGDRPTEARCLLVLNDLSAAYAGYGEDQQNMLDALALMMVASTLHELANPLFGASAGLELLLADPGLQGAQREAVEEVSQELERVAVVTDRLRRLGPRKRRTQTARPLSSLVSEAVAYQGEPLSRSGVVADQRIPGNLPPIPADDTRVVQVLTLTVRDALDRAPEGARLTLEARTLPGQPEVEVILTLTAPDQPAPTGDAPSRETASTDGGALPFALSLARAAALNLGGDLHLEAIPRGMRWIVRLPMVVTDGETSADRR